MRYRWDARLRWSDMDSYGHVNNVILAAYIQEARVRMLGQALAGTTAADMLGHLVVARQRIDYLTPLVYRWEPVCTETWVGAVGAATLATHCEIRDEQTAYCRGEVILAPVDAEARARRFTAPERAALRDLREAVP